MTIGQLKALLGNYPDHQLVKISLPDADWVDIEMVHPGMTGIDRPGGPIALLPCVVLKPATHE